MDIESVIHHLRTGDDVGAQLEDFDWLNQNATVDDLPRLLQELQAGDSGFWVRELLSEPVLRLGGVSVLPDILRALEMNFAEGHDNDSLQGVLGNFANENSLDVKTALKKIDPDLEGIQRKTIDWLLEYCELGQGQ